MDGFLHRALSLSSAVGTLESIQSQPPPPTTTNFNQDLIGFEVPAAATGVPASAGALHDAVGEALLEGKECLVYLKISSELQFGSITASYKCILVKDPVL